MCLIPHSLGVLLALLGALLLVEADPKSQSSSSKSSSSSSASDQALKCALAPDRTPYILEPVPITSIFSSLTLSNSTNTHIDFPAHLHGIWWFQSKDDPLSLVSFANVRPVIIDPEESSTWKASSDSNNKPSPKEDAPKVPLRIRPDLSKATLWHLQPSMYLNRQRIYVDTEEGMNAFHTHVTLQPHMQLVLRRTRAAEQDSDDYNNFMNQKIKLPGRKAPPVPINQTSMVITHTLLPTTEIHMQTRTAIDRLYRHKWEYELRGYGSDVRQGYSGPRRIRAEESRGWRYPKLRELEARERRLRGGPEEELKVNEPRRRPFQQHFGPRRRFRRDGGKDDELLEEIQEALAAATDPDYVEVAQQKNPKEPKLSMDEAKQRAHQRIHSAMATLKEFAQLRLYDPEDPSSTNQWVRMVAHPHTPAGDDCDMLQATLRGSSVAWLNFAGCVERNSDIAPMFGGVPESDGGDGDDADLVDDDVDNYDYVQAYVDSSPALMHTVSPIAPDPIPPQARGDQNNNKDNVDAPGAVRLRRTRVNDGGPQGPTFMNSGSFSQHIQNLKDNRGKQIKEQQVRRERQHRAIMTYAGDQGWRIDILGIHKHEDEDPARSVSTRVSDVEHRIWRVVDGNGVVDEEVYGKWIEHAKGLGVTHALVPRLLSVKEWVGLCL